MLMTLPIEIDASRRAFVLLEKSDLLTAEDRRGARQMLTAAALTYAVTSVFSVVQLGALHPRSALILRIPNDVSERFQP